MKTAEMIHNLDYAMQEIDRDAPFSARLYIKDVLTALHEQLRMESAKSAGELGKVKILDKIAKANPRCEGAWTDGEGKMYVTNGYIAFKMYKYMPCKARPEGGKCLEVIPKLFEIPTGAIEIDGWDIDLPSLKADLKVAKQEYKKSATLQVKIGIQYFNAEYIIQALEVLNGEIKLYQHRDKQFEQIHIIGENGEAVILPMREETKVIYYVPVRVESIA